MVAYMLNTLFIRKRGIHMISSILRFLGNVVLWICKLILETAKLTLILFSMVLRVVLAFVGACTV